ncbi:LacI family DNA-binding transcriptional regulator [Sphingomonas sp. HT-1]|uniref:LacI family DNA-binding transcriptional regulator n=1 Tax=unclassified Sphingomonas TaxID=196159 RepID=UPI00030FDFB7|nr:MULTISPECIES: LacI family DNA-binding transcriptional regulator [unclassified Sphingomonas]KTF69148.1 LacI family transcriptional regulator [Sphingomonas sp. WG]
MAEATIRDVAARAQVSVASVSRALNGLNNVRGDTRERILAAAEELGYVPHAGARSLSLARAHSIGVVLPDLHGEFFSECVRGMDREASRRGYLLLLSNMHDEGDRAMKALRAMRGRVDGLLVMAPHIAPDLLADALSPGLPAVLINCLQAKQARASLRVDNHVGAEAVVRHLVEAGCRQIVHLAGPTGNIDARERAEGYRQAMHRLLPNVPPVVLPGDFNEGAGEALARRIAAGEIACDAVFAANDMMALGCLHGLRSAQIAVPEQIAVAGFDDVPLARYLGLTTVQVRIAELGARAVARLVDQIEGKAQGAEQTLLTPELIVRGTTAQSLHN